MNVSRIIEFCFSLLVAFLVLSLISFLTLRPTLKQVRYEARAEWDSFVRAARERNDLLPGLLEAIRGIEPSQVKMADRVLTARSVSMRSNNPDGIISAVDVIEQYLERIHKLAHSRPEFEQYPPFARHWDQVLKVSRRVSAARRSYNKSVRLYNGLLTPFPQNILTAVFGFVPLTDYPMGRTVGEEE